ncbi:hypothetical protein, partial [Acinetobacter ursingii]|uniref:hypothetical protein n=1 Tax=Acinetobacter ursingii TaxID=108980 RepID=UPI001D191A41
ISTYLAKLNCNNEIYALDVDAFALRSTEMTFHRNGLHLEQLHFAIWQDPTKKPSYLFACVIGDLAVLKDRYTTSEGRDVALEI